MIKIKMGKFDEFKNEQLEDELCREDIQPIIDFVKKRIFILPPFTFLRERFNVVIITEHDLLEDFSIGEIKSLAKGLDGDRILIIVIAYIDEADYPYPYIPDENSHPEKIIRDQDRVFRNHGFVRAKYNNKYRYIVPYIYTNEFGSEILERLDREFSSFITSEPQK